jgi:hypothetical protein
MRTLSSQEIIGLAKCSKATSLEIIYHDLLETKKLYLNRKNNSYATVKWLEKNFDANFTHGNDAPRGGRIGEYVTFTTNSKFDELALLVNSKNDEKAHAIAESKSKNQKAVDLMVISEKEKASFLERTEGLSNKKARAIAHNFAGRKLGFYSNDAKDKFMNLRNE